MGQPSHMSVSYEANLSGLQKQMPWNVNTRENGTNFYFIIKRKYTTPETSRSKN